MPSSSPRGGARPFKPIRAGVLLAVILAAVFALDTARAPWLRAFGLWPTLAGSWYGPVTVEGGPAGVAYFEIDGYVGRRAPALTGRMRWCGPDRRIRDYRLSGAPDTWRGTRFHAELRADMEWTSGVAPGELRGEWSGDEVRAVTPLLRLGGTASVTEGVAVAAPPVAHYTLRRGTEDEFAAECER